MVVKSLVVQSLRQATAALHQQVESTVDILSPTLTIARYVCILQAFHAFFAPAEAEMYARCPAPLRDLWQGRRRAHRLVDDLAALHAEPVDPPPGEFIIPDLSENGRWLGALYVLEGSTLGGQFIARHLERHLNWSGGLGYTFFLAHGDETRLRWRQVLMALEAHPEELSQIVSGARDTFGQLNHCFTAFLGGATPRRWPESSASPF